MSWLTSWKFWISVFLLVGLLVLVELSIGWRSLLAAWEAVPPSYLLLALALILGSYVLRALRFYDFFFQYCQGGLVTMTRITVLHNFFNNLLPMRAGEASFPLLMKQHFHCPYTHSTPALVWLRLLDLYAVLALGSLSLVSPYLSVEWGWLLWPVLIVALFVLPLAVLPLQEWVRRVLSSSQNKVTDKLLELMTALPSSPWPFVRAVAWTLINWAIKLAVFSWLLQTFLLTTGVDAGYAMAWVGATTGELSSVLPIHGVAGAGTYEAGIVAGLLPLGVSAELALAAAVNLHLFVLGSTLVLTGLVSVLTGKLLGSKRQNV